MKRINNGYDNNHNHSQGRTLSSDEYLEQCLHDSRELSKDGKIHKLFIHRNRRGEFRSDKILNPKSEALQSST